LGITRNFWLYFLYKLKTTYPFPKAGFSKDGKHSNPQIFIGLLVGSSGYAIGYDIFEGKTYEGHTLIPFLEKMSGKFNLGKPVVIADPEAS
jgi:transposase